MLAARVRRRRAPCCRWCPRRTTSASSTATPAPTPAAWASTRRCPLVDAGDHATMVEILRAHRRRARRRGHRLPRRALRRLHPHRRGPQGARVQRALRRSRDAGHPAAARDRPRRGAARGCERRARLAGRARVERRRGRLRRAGERRLPGRLRDRQADHGHRRRRGDPGRHRLPRRHEARRGRRRCSPPAVACST